MLLHFSILSEQTQYGPRSFPLDKLDQLPEELRELVLRLSLRCLTFLKSPLLNPCQWRFDLPDLAYA